MKRSLLIGACAGALLLSAVAAAESPATHPRPLVGGHGNNVQAFIAEFDDNGDGKVTWAEFEAFRRARFDATDYDHNGTLDEDEYVREFSERMAAEVERERAGLMEQARSRFAQLGPGTDGLVSRSAFDAAGEKTWQAAQKRLASQDRTGTPAARGTERTAAGAQRFDNGPRSRLNLPSSHSAEGFLELYDSNGDGTVDKAEFQRVRDAQFTRTDSNGDGRLSANEYLAEFESRIDRRAATLDQGEDRQAHVRFGVLDADKDGAMTFAEYQVSGKRLFDTADRNKDGVVDAADAALPAPAPRR
ncbi:EF-hand domain-containing protein [Stenotrophomonas sp. 24(2023)]|uniref:EF-hand domain-containing protein n=1 Tax=Stenotrophomonas sp. 24(2023) TaxID=3068324 RepID=UPI0027E06C45|nr:EF-hand domain-containing protein [Stenotrophomonas sp. 24(2023)]WMJ69436.1 EF-hand domain-containing protein [Stenotrophomonas sp. 24(2023)]